MALGDLFGSDDSEAQDYLKQALQQYQNITVPTTTSETVNNLPQQTVQGVINPNQINAVEQTPSAYNDISLDPSTRQAQINALNTYQNIAGEGGLDAESKLALQQAVNAANIQSQGAQGAIQNQAQAMGQGGGDFALTQRAIAAQGASNNAATQGMQAAAMSEANRENALNQMSNIGGTINTEDYGQAANKAAAQNAINATNQGYQNQANVGNVANNLGAQQFNVSNAQGVNAANTTAGQNQAYYNAALPQQQFNNELQKASGVAGVNSQQATAAQQAQQNSANATGQLLQGGVTLGATALGGPLAGMAANTAASRGKTIGQAPGIGTVSTPNNPNQYKPVGYYDGGYCMSEGGEAHNHYMCMLMGGKVPGTPNVSGDSEQNDTVHAMLSPGEIVVKRSKAHNPDEAAKEAKKISLEHFAKGYKKGRK